MNFTLIKLHAYKESFIKLNYYKYLICGPDCKFITDDVSDCKCETIDGSRTSDGKSKTIDGPGTSDDKSKTIYGPCTSDGKSKTIDGPATLDGNKTGDDSGM